MSLCNIMQDDFMYGWGRYDGELEGYSDNDLRYGIQYAEDYLRIGVSKEPLRHFDLQAFKRWCSMQLKAPS